MQRLRLDSGRLWIAFLLLAGAPFAARGADSPAEVEFFEKRIRPVLVKHCYECHAGAAGRIKGGLRLDHREAVRRGGDSGPAIVPGDADNSLLLSALNYEAFEMPPAGPLPDDVIADFRRWIERGAADPRAGDVPVEPRETPAAARAESLWSLRPLAPTPVPAVADAGWPRGAVDRFVLARLEEAGLRPVGDAPPEILLRRVYFDLVGLPPDAPAVSEFVQDPSEEAFAAVVDRLLDSPHFGERWGRHWLDVVRYAESNGRDRDVLMPHAWRYRDYVIDAMNADLPYDRFVTEQIAGDLLAASGAAERDRQRMATGMLAVGSKSLTGNRLHLDLIDDQIDVVTRAFLGLTVSCARCHDHKYDPVPTRDYYALAGIFKSTTTLFGGGLRRPKDTLGKLDVLLVVGDDADARVTRLRERKQEIDALTQRERQAQKRLKQLQKELPENWKERLAELRAAGGEDPKIRKYAETRSELREAQARLKELKAQPVEEVRFAVGVRESEQIVDSRLHIRGEPGQTGDPVPRGFLSCLPVSAGPLPENQSGRRELARWLTHPENPLTPRVMVNRVWSRLTGQGLVRTVDNFGANAALPSHPRLLDFLARRLVEQGWSRKALIREIVMSRTYRQASEYRASNHARDPENRLLWRGRRRRLEAEAIRDAMLAASGRLDRNRPTASAVARIGDGEVGRGIDTRPLEEPFPHRSVYLPILRTKIPEMLKRFDFPEPSNIQGQRATTNVPAQSLFLMNHPFVLEQSAAMARRVRAGAASRDDRVALAYRLAVARVPHPAERQRALEFLEATAQRLAEPQTPRADVEQQVWSMFCQALLASAEFRYLR